MAISDSNTESNSDNNKDPFAFDPTKNFNMDEARNKMKKQEAKKGKK